MNQEKYMKSHVRSTTACQSLYVFVVAVSLCALGGPVQALPTSKEQSDAPQVQKAFKTPQEAADTLIQAAEAYDVSTLLEIFGPEGKDFISSSDPIRDKTIAASFAAKAREKNIVTVDPRDKTRAILSVGNEDWPLPVPIVNRKGKWYFDSKQGRDEILFRRIGSNELDALQVCRGFVEAQQEYASEVHDDSQINQYAQRIISTTVYIGKTTTARRVVPSGKRSLALSRKVIRQARLPDTTATTSRFSRAKVRQLALGNSTM
jgi:Protein of unknown function (DUF2950)